MGHTAQTGSGGLSKAVVAVLVVVVIVAAIVLVMQTRSSTLPTGEAMGVDIPKPNLPAAGQSHNPYSAKNRPQQTPKQEQSGGQQPWGN